MSHLIEVKNLQTEFKQEKGTLKAANGVSYYLDPGEIVAFVGESGSGKSVTQYSSLQLIPSPPERSPEERSFLKEKIFWNMDQTAMK